MRDYIKSIGIELEGGFYDERVYLLEEWGEGFSWGYDGSVNVSCPWGSAEGWISNIELKFWATNIQVVCDFIKEVFALGFVQNEDCGNHNHIRLKNKKLYGAILDYDFMLTYISYYQQFAKKYNETKYLKRLKNGYCKAFNDEIEAICPGDRFKIFNVFSLFERQKTLEIRIMPYGESAQEVIEQVKFNYNIINDLLAYCNFSLEIY